MAESTPGHVLCAEVDRFRVWPAEGEGGTWWCRGCEKGGDIIQYLREIRKLSYQEACFAIGQKPEPMKCSFDWGKAANSETRNSRTRKWEPRETVSPPDEWIRKCSAFVDWCHEQLLKEDQILAYVKDCRGLSENTIKAFHLGWNPQNLSRRRKLWGLEEETGADEVGAGKEGQINDKANGQAKDQGKDQANSQANDKPNGKPKSIWLPQGLVIPYYVDGILQRARIRRLDSKGHNPKKSPPYCVVSGSSSAAMITEDICNVLVVVESELDAILLNQESGHLAGIIALGSAQARPDRRAAELLRAADLILVSLDSDDQRDDGKNPGAKEAWGWWLKHFDQARRLPPIDGKDPGEMWKAGVSLSEWIAIGIEKYQRKESGGYRVQEINSPPLDNTAPIQEAINPPLDSAVQGTVLIVQDSVQIVQDSAPIEQLSDQTGMVDQLTAACTAKLEDIALKYPDGCHEWVQQNMPELYKGICSDDHWLNEVWELCLAGRAAIQDFQSALDIWYEGWMEAIHSYHLHLHLQNQHSLPKPKQQSQLNQQQSLLKPAHFVIDQAESDIDTQGTTQNDIQGNTKSLCPACGGSKWWTSIYHVRICTVCHPPAVQVASAWDKSARGE